MAIVEVIRDALVAADPDNAALYTANAEAYLAELTELDAFIEAQVAELPVERRKLVTTHDTFGYFAARYGFEIVGTALGASTEAADPSAGAIAELVEAIRAAGVPAIFAENVSNMRLMETIAREAGVTLAPDLYTDALGAPGSPGATYLEMMRYNVTTIVQALGA
jgi:ABC-type Zn uptake system ZnuABC Zn-binding protein ZnuA